MTPSTALANEKTDVLAPWRSGVTIRPVCPETQAHTIHTYFNISPESPDGRFVLFFRSTTPEGHDGEICIIERKTGKETVLVKNVHAEDAHRAAAQQWVCGGKRVAFQNGHDGRWSVESVNVDGTDHRVQATDRLIGLSPPNASFVALYGPHWKLGEHRDLEMLDVQTGEIRTVLTNQAVRAAYPEWVNKTFGDRETSLFFAMVSPDLKKVMVKLSAPNSGKAQSADSSIREGLIVYNIAEKRFQFMHERWGHPFWSFDSKTIIQQHDLLIDADTGQTTKIPNMIHYWGSHPSSSPDGRLLLKDVILPKEGVDPKHWKEWGIDLCDIRGGNELILDRFDNSGGAKSWRVSHPHPTFSADGRRIYYNVSRGQWTRLFVAERTDVK